LALARGRDHHSARHVGPAADEQAVAALAFGIVAWFLVLVIGGAVEVLLDPDGRLAGG